MFFFLQAISPPQWFQTSDCSSPNMWAKTHLSCTALVLVFLSILLVFKGCNWTTLLIGTLASVARPASLEHMVVRGKQSQQSRGLITLISGSRELLPGVSHSKYTWLPLLDALWPFCLSHQAPRFVCELSFKKHSGALAWWIRFRAVVVT